MAFPTVVQSATSFKQTNSTSIPVTMPSGITSGNLLLVFIAMGNISAPALDWSTEGYTELIEIDNTAGSNPAYSIGYRTAGGSEPSSLALTASGNTRNANIVLEISGFSGTPDVSTGVTATNDTAPDPDTVTASGGSADNLFIATYAASFGNGAVPTAWPTNYGDNNISASHDSGQSTRTALAVATRNLASASDNPGTFSQAATGAETCACTIVIAPSAGAAAVPERMKMGVGI